jgi:hypothetical protein
MKPPRSSRGTGPWPGSTNTWFRLLFAGVGYTVINCFDLLNHEAEFLIFKRRVQDGATSDYSGESFMNINFAFACLIVVSFAIALGHG